MLQLTDEKIIHCNGDRVVGSSESSISTCYHTAIFQDPCDNHTV